MITRLVQAVVLMIGVGAAAGSWAAAENKPPAEGAAPPAITLAVPADAGHQAYLGLAGKKQFSVGDVQAEVVIIQIFNMY
ncbi:MAG: hypothetical protein MUC33_18370 [Desulfobacterales bacterium]|jgi:hypothetical protein|nr:hypothetical protein [Desulfobacterales bacterium]